MITGNILKVWEDKEKYYASISVNDKENIEHIIEIAKKDFGDIVSNQDIKESFIREISNKVILEKEKEEIPVPKEEIDFSQILGEIVLNDVLLEDNVDIIPEK